MQDKMAP